MKEVRGHDSQPTSSCSGHEFLLEDLTWPLTYTRFLWCSHARAGLWWIRAITSADRTRTRTSRRGRSIHVVTIGYFDSSPSLYFFVNTETVCPPLKAFSNFPISINILCLLTSECGHIKSDMYPTSDWEYVTHHFRMWARRDLCSWCIC